MQKKRNLINKIGIFGGTFDPPHRGHFEIAKHSIKKLKLSFLIWAVTKKNPLKKSSMLSVKSRIYLSQKITRGNKKIKIRNFDNNIKSEKTINLLKYLKNKNPKSELFFIIGSDNLLTFHKWHGWQKIPSLCKIVVFPRQGYFNKSLTSKAYRKLKKDRMILIKSKITNISSSKIRKNYLR